MNRRQFLFLGSGLILVTVSKSIAETGRQQPIKNTTGFVYDRIYLDHWLGPGHPESPQRLIRIKQTMEQTGLINQVSIIEPLKNVLPYIKQIHTTEHVEQIQAGYGRSHDVAVAVVGGVLAAVRAVCHGNVKNAFCATRPPGHHALNSGREEGFCFYNAIAIATRYAQTEFNLEKILIVDWDYHHGNGTEAAFYTDPSVLFLSTHDFYAYPGTGDPARTGAGAGEGYNINVHLDCGSTDSDIINVFENTLIPAADRFKPDLILISAGFDSRKDDLLGCFNISDNGFVILTQILMELADKHCNGRIISVLEGGYNIEGNASAVTHHVRTLSGG